MKSLARSIADNVKDLTVNWLAAMSATIHGRKGKPETLTKFVLCREMLAIHLHNSSALKESKYMLYISNVFSVANVSTNL